MNKQKINEIVLLTQECLRRYWQRDCEFVLSYCDRDVVWIGSIQYQYIEGFEATADDFRNSVKEMPPCHLLKQEFTVVSNSRNSCTVVGRYLTTTDEGAEYFLQVEQRCTFVWEYLKDKPLIKHIHISNPMGELKISDRERIPNAMGKMAKKYWLNHMLSERDKVSRIVVTDTNDIVHCFLPNEIMYVSANGRSCDICTVEGDIIDARMKITDFLNSEAGSFIAVHRSYVLNAVYISRIEKYDAVMTDGSRIPIPKKRFKEVRDKIINYTDVKTD